MQKKSALVLVAFSSLLFANCASKAQKESTPAAGAPVTKAQPAPTKAAVSEAAAPTKTETPAPTGMLTCTHSKETRTVQIAAKGDGCEVNYTKGGSTTAVASEIHGTKHCTETQAKIQDHLEKSGYTCKVAP